MKFEYKYYNNYYNVFRKEFYLYVHIVYQSLNNYVRLKVNFVKIFFLIFPLKIFICRKIKYCFYNFLKIKNRK